MRSRRNVDEVAVITAVGGIDQCLKLLWVLIGRIFGPKIDHINGDIVFLENFAGGGQVTRYVRVSVCYTHSVI